MTIIETLEIITTTESHVVKRGRSSLYSSFIEDIKTNDCSFTDFFFIPLISFDKNSIKFDELRSLES